MPEPTSAGVAPHSHTMSDGDTKSQSSVDLSYNQFVSDGLTSHDFSTLKFYNFQIHHVSKFKVGTK